MLGGARASLRQTSQAALARAAAPRARRGSLIPPLRPPVFPPLFAGRRDSGAGVREHGRHAKSRVASRPYDPKELVNRAVVNYTFNEKENDSILNACNKMYRLLIAYEYVVRDEVMAKLQWKFIIVDKGHRKKNPPRRLTKLLNTHHLAPPRLLLTEKKGGGTQGRKNDTYHSRIT